MLKKFICLFILVIQFTQITLAVNKESLNVTCNQLILSSQLKKYYSGYQYDITNRSDSNLEIISAQIVNGNDGSIAYATTNNNEPSAVAKTWIIAGPIGLVTAGIAWIVGIIATPFVAIISSSKKKKSQIESLSYSNKIPLGYINSDETVSVNTLVIIGSKPSLQLTVKDLSDNKIYSFNY